MSRPSPSSSSPTRRQFLGALGTGLAASVAGPTILHATDKAGTKRPVVGSGEFTYEVHHDWGELPAGLKYGNTHGVGEDAQGRIYVHHTVHAPSDSTTRWSCSMRRASSSVAGARISKAARTACTSPRRAGRNSSILCDTKRGAVTKITPTGEAGLAARLSERVGAVPGERRRDAGRKVLADQRRHRARRRRLRRRRLRLELHQPVRRVGQYMRTFGGKGKAAGQLDCPHGLIVDTRAATPVLLVADRSNRRLQSFSLDGVSGFTKGSRIRVISASTRA